MIPVICRTNLDLRGERWPVGLPAIPNVGDEIQSATKRGNFQLCLQVVRVTWRSVEAPGGSYPSWTPEIELHMANFQKMLPSKDPKAATGSIKAFYEWYAPLVGTTPSAFI